MSPLVLWPYHARMDQPERQRVFDGVKFSVDVVRRPRRGGGFAQREVVLHPGAVVVLGLLPDDRIVLIRNERFAVGKTLLELPAGTLEPPEPPEACAARELIEETGYQAGRLETMTRFYTSPGICTELMHAFLATDLKPVGQSLEETEQITVEPTALGEALEHVRRGRIQDAKTIATLLYFKAFIRDGR
jgi:ADP-ribose pyrophosphatase